MVSLPRLHETQRWIDGCAEPVPLTAQSTSEALDSLTEFIESREDLRGTLVEAFLGLRIGQIDRPHAIVQNGSTVLEKYLHGVIHRLEGDFWNSDYWFRQVRDNDFLSRLGKEMIHRLSGRGMLKEAELLDIFDGIGRFVPSRFVEAQQKNTIGEKTSDLSLLRQIGHVEWESLWNLYQIA